MMNTFSCCVCGTAIAVIETDHSLLDLVKADATDDELLSIIDQRPHTIFAADSVRLQSKYLAVVCSYLQSCSNPVSVIIYNVIFIGGQNSADVGM